MSPQTSIIFIVHLFLIHPSSVRIESLVYPCSPPEVNSLIIVVINWFVLYNVLISHNNETISIAIVGNYMSYNPSPDVISSLEHLLDYIESNHLVTADYTLFAMCEVRDSCSPGINLYNELKNIYSRCNISIYYPRICGHLVCGIVSPLVRSTCDSFHCCLMQSSS
jgi:hypothetical protein